MSNLTDGKEMTENIVKKKKSLIPQVAVSVILVGTISLVLYFTVFSKEAVTRREIEHQMEQAQNFLDELDYEQAIVAYQAVIELDPNNRDAYEKLADTYIEWAESVAEEDPVKAEEILAEAEEYFANAEENTENETIGEAISRIEEARLQAEEEVQHSATRFSSAAIGSYITFGHYEQDNDTSNGTEPIEWLVLAHEESKTLVISRYGLDCVQYDTSGSNVTWETCTIRRWLNEMFIQSAFTAEEQERIMSVTNDNPDSYSFWNSDYAINKFEENSYEANGWGAYGGNTTQDKVFCLSWSETLDYFGDANVRFCTPTAYAEAQGTKKFSEGDCWWWLRSPGRASFQALYVNGNGTLFTSYVAADNFAVRPALWITD